VFIHPLPKEPHEKTPRRDRQDAENAKEERELIFPFNCAAYSALLHLTTPGIFSDNHLLRYTLPIAIRDFITITHGDKPVVAIGDGTDGLAII